MTVSLNLLSVNKCDMIINGINKKSFCEYRSSFRKNNMYI